MVNCPRCNAEVMELHAVDGDLASALQSGGIPAPPQVCLSCISDLRRASTQSAGGVLAAQAKAKELHRNQMWKSRVQLIKRARVMMNEKNLSEAAVAYEKYIKILELVFGCKKGEHIKPQMFKDHARTSELTVVASVYWDLLRLYDSNERYLDRQKIAAAQLAQFVRFTPIFPDIIKKAEAFVSKSHNPGVIKSFLKGAAEQRPRCFIATSAFESPFAVEVQILRHFRDFTLLQSSWGRAFVFIYEAVSPSFAHFLDKHPGLKPLCRKVLRLFIQRL